MRKRFLTMAMTLGLALAVGLPVSRDGAAAQPAPELLRQVHADGHMRNVVMVSDPVHQYATAIGPMAAPPSMVR